MTTEKQEAPLCWQIKFSLQSPWPLCILDLYIEVLFLEQLLPADYTMMRLLLLLLSEVEPSTSAEGHTEGNSPRHFLPLNMTCVTSYKRRPRPQLDASPFSFPINTAADGTNRAMPRGWLDGEAPDLSVGGSMCGPVIIYWWWPCLVGHITQRPVKSVSASNPTTAAELLHRFSSVHFVWSCGPVVLCQFSPAAQCWPFNHISDELTHYVQFLPWGSCLDFTHLPTTRSVADEQLQLLHRFCLHFFLQQWINGLLPCCTSCHMSTWLQVQSSKVSDRGETFCLALSELEALLFFLLLLLPPASKL